MLATEERRRGYFAALAAGGLTPSPDLVVEATFDVAGGRAAAALLLDMPEPPTAIFAFNDPLAIGAIQAAQARGFSVPRDLSIVGFDDTDEAELVTPALTTVRQPLAEMGRLGVSLLARLLENRRLEALHVELATQLVIRDSTTTPPVRGGRGSGSRARA
jgi:LacI family transcriptional regulator